MSQVRFNVSHSIQATSIALRGTYQSSGQNCAGCERVLIQASVFDASLEKLVAGARSLRQRAPLKGDPTAVDAGALALPGLAQTIASLVDDAVFSGAKVRLSAIKFACTVVIG
jgi:acyl-CoA reductase-like NAD-dependent aldehyde dehydrogenase